MSKIHFVKRSELIEKCELFLNESLTVDDIVNYSYSMMFSDDYDWEDNVISEVIFCWNNEVICYPINNENMKLWLSYLKTSENPFEQINNAK